LFTQAGHAVDRVQDGLGIGLSLSKTLVELHNGSIQATSRGVGLGSQFEIRLPLSTISSDTDSFKAATAEASTGKYRVLVVDDNREAAEIIAELLRIDGHEVATAHTGADALLTVRRHQPAVVILDIGLPDMDGTTVAGKIRAIPGMQNASLIALTGYGNASDIERTKAAGFNDHLVKPAKFALLRASIQRLRENVDGPASSGARSG
jgi:CheY-like chemotaxis protein